MSKNYQISGPSVEEINKILYTKHTDYSELVKAAECVLASLLNLWINSGAVLDIEEKRNINVLRSELDKLKCPAPAQK